MLETKIGSKMFGSALYIELRPAAIEIWVGSSFVPDWPWPCLQYEDFDALALGRYLPCTVAPLALEAVLYSSAVAACALWHRAIICAASDNDVLNGTVSKLLYA